MKRMLGVAVLAAAAVLVSVPTSASAQSGASAGAEHRKSKYYRGKGPQVRGYQQRRGGYSYSPEDTINTYGDSRTMFGSSNSFRDPMLDRQTRFGPFDHGFFFDSGVLPRGGNSPYMN